MGGLQVHLDSVALRRAAYAVENMIPGGTERPANGRVTNEDLAYVRTRLAESSERRSPDHAEALTRSARCVHELERALARHHAQTAVYVGPSEFALEPELRAAAIEVDFVFGDRDGEVGLADLSNARRRYGNVRGPVGWNRNLLTDDLERALFPGRVLSSAKGPRLSVEDWLGPRSEPMIRLPRILPRIDDAMLARTFADAAARSVTVGSRARFPELHQALRDGMMLMGQEITRRRSVRPSLSDIARIGCDDAETQVYLATPIEMSRLLIPSQLLEPFFGDL